MAETALEHFRGATEMQHTWTAHAKLPYIILKGRHDAVVRTKPHSDGRYLWQFNKVVSYADTIEKAKEYVEAGAEFFQAFKRSPYA